MAPNVSRLMCDAPNVVDRNRRNTHTFMQLHVLTADR